MKRFIGLMALMLVQSCSYSERDDWDSGSRARNADRQQREEQRVDRTNDQVLRPGTATPHQPQPF